MSTLFRRDETVVDSGGRPVSGVQVFVCGQPANTSTIPPTPLIQLYADSAGANLLTAPPQTDAYGHCFCYLPTGAFTICYYSTQLSPQLQSLPDQLVVPPQTSAPQFNSDSSANSTITPAPDGTETEFNLSTPPVINSLVFMINGIVQTGYTIVSGLATVVLHTPPLSSDVLTAFYEITSIS
jgi:hypothetical protein